MSSWWHDAACRGMDGDLFHPEQNDEATKRAAVAICNECPVSTECLAWALDHNEQGGIWGGTTIRQRRRIRRGMAT